VLGETENLLFLETSYLQLKKMQWRATRENPVSGLGPGNFNAFLKQAKDQGEYPAHLADYDPHSSLGGTLAEMGILGLLALLCWAFVIFRMIRRLLKKKQDPVFFSAVACYLLFIGVETLTTDVLNFRHLWVCLGVMAWEYKKAV
jgi:O-antigen ligase